VLRTSRFVENQNWLWIAQCGACTIHLDGPLLFAPVTPVSALENAEITTIEGISGKWRHPSQKAWVEHDLPQCGYCQWSKSMSALALLKSNPLSSDEIDNAM